MAHPMPTPEQFLPPSTRPRPRGPSDAPPMDRPLPAAQMVPALPPPQMPYGAYAPPSPRARRSSSGAARPPAPASSIVVQSGSPPSPPLIRVSSAQRGPPYPSHPPAQMRQAHFDDLHDARPPSGRSPSRPSRRRSVSFARHNQAEDDYFIAGRPQHQPPSRPSRRASSPPRDARRLQDPRDSDKKSRRRSYDRPPPPRRRSTRRPSIGDTVFAVFRSIRDAI